MSSHDNTFLMQWNARIRKSPYFDATRRHGAKVFSVYNHMFIPQAYEDYENEYEHVTGGVTLWDVSVEQPVEITGPDAFTFTNMLTPRDLTNCKIGQCKYVVITAEDGGIVNDPVLSRLGENHFWLAPADSELLLWVKGVAVHSDADVSIQLADAWPVQVQGPKSKQVMQVLFGAKLLELAYYEFMETDLNGAPVVVARTGWTGELGYEIYLRDTSRGDELWDAVMEAGRPYDIVPIGPSHIRRVEAGILNYRIDMTLDTNPYEVGSGWLVDLDQEADFIGKAALNRVKEQGVKRKLVGVEVHGNPLAPNQHRWPVKHDSERIGDLTSCVYSPGLEKNIGYALVPIEYAGLGTTLTIETPLGDAKATVVRKPFVDPKKDIPKS